MSINSKFLNRISDISKIDFENNLNGYSSPFMSYEFLSSLEESGSVGVSNGWQPFHFSSYENDKLNGFMPLYLKNNSQGEFVFDHQWSYALSRANRSYYPKLLSAIPFTPCETKKIITSNNNEDYCLESTKQLMEEKNIETWHILFPSQDTGEKLISNDFIKRSGYRFVWNNKKYKVFEDYLNIFTSKQRKNIKTERRKIKNAGITFITKDYDSITEEDWDDFYLFYKNTYAERMQAPYLNRQFFKHINRDKKALKPVLFFAVYENRKIAGSLCFQGEDTLYGRHWGAFENIDNLHFECCYYQGIDYCIKNNIKYFDPGVQGEHKIRRGFEPQSCDSYHYVLQEDFRDAIKNFCYEESKSVESYLRACQEYTLIKKEYRI